MIEGIICQLCCLERDEIEAKGDTRGSRSFLCLPCWISSSPSLPFHRPKLDRATVAGELYCTAMEWFAVIVCGRRMYWVRMVYYSIRVSDMVAVLCC